VIHLASTLKFFLFFFFFHCNLLQFKESSETLPINIQALGFTHSRNSISVLNVFKFEVKRVKNWKILFSGKEVGK